MSDLRQEIDYWTVMNHKGAVLNKEYRIIHVLATPEQRAHGYFEVRQTLCRPGGINVWKPYAAVRKLRDKRIRPCCRCLNSLKISSRKHDTGQTLSLGK